MDTITINISEAKTNLSHYANLVRKGKTVLLARRNVPFAQIITIAHSPAELLKKRKALVGDLKDKVKVVGDVNASLSKKELADWYADKLTS